MRVVDFFVVGAMRSGTSTLTQCLSKHSDIFMLRNEPKFFSSWDGADRDSLDEYHARFDWNPRFVLRGEKSAPYGPSLQARDQIRAYNPQAKIIWMLRDPVKRAVSHFYRAYAASGDKAISLKQAIAEKEGLEKRNHMWAYVYRSEYYKQIMHWLDVFPISQVHLAVFEEMMRNPKAEIARLCEFLGVDARPEMYPEERAENSKTTAQGILAAPVEQDTLDALYEALVPDIESLFEFIGRRIPEWRR